MLKNSFHHLVTLLVSILLLSCQQETLTPDFSQPVVNQYVEKSTETVNGVTVTTGPLKDYEIDSEVIYKIVVSSKKPLYSFSVSSSSDAVSQASHIVATQPADVMDEKGIFTKKVNEVVIYYAYHIHPLVLPLTSVTVTFNLFNTSKNSSSVYHTFSVIKKGSTDGKLLKVIDLSYTSAISRGINTQSALLDESEGIRPEGQANRSGPMFSFKYKYGLTNDLDAIAMANDIDFVGYQTFYAGTDPVLVNNNFYLVSPSDSVVLTSTYAGAVAASLLLQGSSGTANITLAGITRLATFKTNVTTTASDFVNANKAVYATAGLTLSTSSGKLIWTATKKGVGFEPAKIVTLTGNLYGVNEVSKNIRKNLIMRNTIRQMAKKLQNESKALRVVYFKRLDNITGPNRVTPEDFDILTHDNEFDTLLAGIEQEKKTMTDLMDLNQVYGFVMSDGKRGLFRTAPLTVFLEGTNVSVTKPNASNWNLYGVIKYQDPNN